MEEKLGLHLTSVWTQDIQLWGIVSDSNIVIIARFHSKVIRETIKALCSTNTIIERSHYSEKYLHHKKIIQTSWSLISWKIVQISKD